MDKATRKTLWIMVGILVAEGVPFFLTIGGSAPGSIDDCSASMVPDPRGRWL
jgi:hypothetical protein